MLLFVYSLINNKSLDIISHVIDLYLLVHLTVKAITYCESQIPITLYYLT